MKKNTETKIAPMTFLKTSGSWAEAKEYYSNDFAGVVHNGAHKVNVKLDGMDYVWSDGAGYTRIRQVDTSSATVIRRLGLLPVR